MRSRTSLLAIVPVLVAAACAPKNEAVATSDTAATAATATAPDAGTARQAIEAANARFMDATKRGDATAASANYADDAVMIWANEKPWRGREAIKGQLARILETVVRMEDRLTTEDVMTGGDLAVETGTYQTTAEPKGGRKEIKESGNYMTVWKRQPDGSWKIVRDIAVADAPPNS